MSKERLFCTFFVDKFFIGIEVQKIQEIIPYHEMTRVPLASQEIRGLINLRGQIVTAIDLRRRMNLQELPPDERPMNVVIKCENDEVVSLLVDKIGDVITVMTDNFETPPETLQGLMRTLISGVYKLEDRLLLVLDTDKTIDIAATPQKVNVF